MQNEPLVFDVLDFRKKRVIFTHKKRKEKRISHPELDRREFLEAVQSTVVEPDVVWPDRHEKQKHCYYREYGEGVYVKVVVYMSYNRHEPSRVVSAYMIDKIKEEKYRSEGLQRIV
jgi:hypothetical protein